MYYSDFATRANVNFKSHDGCSIILISSQSFYSTGFFVITQGTFDIADHSSVHWGQYDLAQVSQ